MSRARCGGRIPLEALLDYWLADPPPADADALERHLLECGECSAALETIVAVAEGIRRLGGEARLRGGASPTVLDRLERDRRVIRRYRAAAGGHIHCTAGKDDDLVTLELSADLAGIERVDLEYCAEDGTPVERATDLPVAHGRTVVWVEPGDAIRALPTSIIRVRLLAVEAGAERQVAEYTLHHTAYRG
jgi:hypothetical protein